MKKIISIMIPTYNEEENITPLIEEIVKIMSSLTKYDYEIVIIDNDSKDKTRENIREICLKNKKVKAIFNSKNFGQFNSPFYGMQQTTGDCTITMCADFQDPPELIIDFIKEWEKGNKIVIGIKNKSRESKIFYFFRSCYYKLIKKFSNVEQIEHFTGFGLYDSSFIEVLKNLDDSTPYLRGIVAELGYKIHKIPYEQQKRKFGKTHNNLFTLYDAAMLGFTSYTKIGIRLATFVGFIIALISFLIGIIYLILKLIFWNSFAAGVAPILITVLFFSSLQMIFIGLLGEYILAMNSRIMKRPLVIEEERINFKVNKSKVK